MNEMERTVDVAGLLPPARGVWSISQAEPMSQRLGVCA